MKIIYGQLTNQPLTELQIRSCIYYNQHRFRSMIENHRLFFNNLARYKSRNDSR